MIEIIGKIIGFLFLGFIVYLLIKNKGLHPEIFQLEDNEEIKETVKGDYWEKGLLQESRNSGEFAFTNKRILFNGIFKNISIPYSEISSVEKAYVGMFLPFAFKVSTKDNKEYKFAVMKRDKFIDIINSSR